MLNIKDIGKKEKVVRDKTTHFYRRTLIQMTVDFSSEGLKNSGRTLAKRRKKELLTRDSTNSKISFRNGGKIVFR